jgi:hypothetical protein
LYSLRLWDAEWQHQISAAYLGDRRQAEAIAFSSDGQQLAAAVNDRSIPGKESGYVLLF